MAAGDEVDPELAGGLQARLLRLAGEEEVVALVGGVDQVAAGGARADRDALDPVRAVREDERLAADRLADTGGELVDAERLAQRPALPDLGERTLDLDPERLGEQGVVAELRMRVEREVVRGQAEVGGEERLEPATLAPVDPDRLVPPEHPVVDDHQLGPGRGRALEELLRGRDAARDLRHLVRAEHLQAGRPVLGEAVDCEQFVGEADDLVALSHGPIIATLSPLGVWRSLVARSVRVGEVRSSNLRTPIESWGSLWLPHEPFGGRSERGARRRLRLRRSSVSATSDPLFTHCCHCLNCQRQTGSAFVVNALIEADRVELLAGEPKPVDVPRSGGKKQRIFRCPICEIAVYSRYTRASILFVRGGTLDDPSSVAPDVHIYTRSKLSWVTLPDSVPAFTTYYDTQKLWPAASLDRLGAITASKRSAG